MNAAEIARALKGKKAGNGWKAKCPAHDDSNPSLHISAGKDGRILVHCFSGCTQQDVVEALKNRGLWKGEVGPITPAQRRMADEHQRREKERRITDAVRIWDASASADHAQVKDYLAARKLTLPAELCGDTLRFHPACPWEKIFVPCLIAAFRSIAGDTITGIHRIRLDQPERWPKADRMMLGVVGGSAVKLDAIDGTTLAVGEGIETCMAARQFGFHSVWALGSAGGIEELPRINGITELRILGERDGGRNKRAAIACTERWVGCDVFHIMPPEGFKDFNDVIMERKNASAV